MSFLLGPDTGTVPLSHQVPVSPATHCNTQQHTATHNVIWMCMLTCLYVYDVGVCMPTNCNGHLVWRYSPFSQSSLSISVYAYVYWHSLIHISIRVHTFAWTNTYTIYTTLIPQTCQHRPTATCDPYKYEAHCPSQAPASQEMIICIYLYLYM